MSDARPDDRRAPALPVPSSRVLEWLGCFFGLAGAFLLATHSDVSRYGWIAFLAANVALMVFARRIRAHGLLMQQVGFTAASLLGLYRAFVAGG